MPIEKLTILKSKKFLLPNKSKTLNCIIWFTSQKQDYLFKYSKDDTYKFKTIANEVLISTICKRLNLPCQQANFASFRKVTGVKIKSFLNEGEEEIPIYNIVNEVYIQKLKNIMGDNFIEEVIIPMDIELYSKKNKDKMTNKTALLSDIDTQLSYLIDCHYKTRDCSPDVLKFIDKKFDDIWELYEKYDTPMADKELYDTIIDYSQKNNLKVDKQLKLQICQELIADYITNQQDRHLNNISIIKNKDTIRLAPMYDNGHCLKFQNNFNPHKRQLQLTNFTYEAISTNNILKRNLYSFNQLLTKYKDDFIETFIKENSPVLDLLVPKYSKDKDLWIKDYMQSNFKLMYDNLINLENEMNKSQDLNRQN